MNNPYDMRSFLIEGGELVDIAECKNFVKGEYIQGSVSLIIHGICVFDQNRIDDMDMLWPSFSNRLFEYLSLGNAVFSYPSQPYIVQITRNDKFAKILISNPKTDSEVSLVAKDADLINSFIYAGEEFFRIFILLHKSKIRARQYDKHLQRIVNFRRERFASS